MSNLKYPHLFEPITLGGTMFKNRLFSSPTGWQYMNRFCDLEQDAIGYYERKAKGGAASVTMGEMQVDHNFKTGPRHTLVDDPWGKYTLMRIANAIHVQGGNISGELCHSGASANRELGITGEASRGMAYGPIEQVVDGRIVLPMTEEQILDVIDKFAKAAAYLKTCGFDMVTVHAGHGWLLNQFMNPNLNTRTDKWGGPSIENRARLTVEVCRAIRKACGRNFPIEVRISASEAYPGGYQIDEGIAFAKMLDGECDLIHVSAGSHEIEQVFTVTHPSLFLEDGVNVKYAAEIKKHVKTPVATIGALSDPDLMEEIIASGKADVIEMARALICDPDLPQKAREGRTDEIRKCMRCLACYSGLCNNGQFYCAINPEAGREIEARYEIPAAKKKKVLIIGGGVAGMEAALDCHKRGHEVILCEKNGELGGALRCESNVPFKQNLHRYLDQQVRRIEAAGIEVRLNTTVTPEMADEIKPDAIIAAIGSVPRKLRLPGIDNKNVFVADDVFRKPELTGDKVVILGAGLVGVEVGIYLAMNGKKVEIVEMLDRMNFGGNHLHGIAVKYELIRQGIEVHFNTSAKEITDTGVKAVDKDGNECFFEADSVVYAVGQIPLREEGASFRACAPEFYQIADCVNPRSIMDATSQAYGVSRNIGRV